MADVKEAPGPKTNGAKGQGQATEAERRPPAPVAWDGNPLACMRQFAEEMDRLFEGFGLRLPSVVGRGRELLRREAGLIPAEWSPRVEVRERDGRILVHADLPGLSKDDIKVEVTEESLTIQGERKAETKEEREGYSYSECSYGSFYRSLPLPEGIDVSQATAEFRNGVLEVSLPAPPKAETRARRLEVQEKS